VLQSFLEGRIRNYNLIWYVMMMCPPRGSIEIPHCGRQTIREGQRRKKSRRDAGFNEAAFQGA